MKVVETSLSELAFQAESGDAAAQYQLAALFIVGESVEQDLNAASLWMARAASAQYPGAQKLAEQLASCRALSGRAGKSIPFHHVADSVIESLTSRLAAATIRSARRLQSSSHGVLSKVTDLARKLTANRNFRPPMDATDFPSRRSQGFEYTEAS